MALIKCRYCGKDISDKAKTCVHCGHEIISIDKINQERKTKTRKKLKIFGITMISLILLIGIYIGFNILFPVKSINFMEKYHDYLDYTFDNDWEIIKTEKYLIFKQFRFHEYYDWLIAYEDSNGLNKEIRISNYELQYHRNEKKASDYVFASEIIYRYREELNNELSFAHVSELDDYINIIDLYYLDHNRYAKEILETIDVKKGLNFKNLSINQLSPNYYYLEFSVLYESGTDIENYTINEAKKIIDKYQIKNAIISTGMDTDNYGTASPIYCLRDGKEFHCPSDNNLDTMNNTLMHRENYITID